MRHTHSLAVCIHLLACSAVIAQTESVISEYNLSGDLLRQFGGAGIDSGIVNKKIVAGPSDQIYALRDNVDGGPSFLGEYRIFSSEGTYVSATSLDGINPTDRPLTGISFGPSVPDVYISTGSGIGDATAPESRGSIFRLPTNGGAPLVLQPFSGEVQYNDVLVLGSNQRIASATRGNAKSDNQMTRFASTGGLELEFSPTGQNVVHLDMARALTSTFATLVRPADTTLDGYGWKLMTASGDITLTVNKGTADAFLPVGLEIRNGSLWTFNQATQSLERYMINGTLQESYLMSSLGADVTDFTFSPTGTALFSHFVIPSPATGALATLAGLVLAQRRRR